MGNAVEEGPDVQLSSAGRLRVFASTAVPVIIDAQGWLPPPGDDNGTTYTAANPARVLDTRTATRAGQCAITPTGATATANCTTVGADVIVDSPAGSANPPPSPTPSPTPTPTPCAAPKPGKSQPASRQLP